MEVILAKSAGFCYGVRRAVELARQTATERGVCWMLGDLIHNAHVIAELSALGIRRTSDPGSLNTGDIVIIRSHGEQKNVLDDLSERGVTWADATCPNVRRIQELVAEAEREGRQPVIIGEPNHPEVMGMASWCARPLILEGPDSVREWMAKTPDFRSIPVTVVAQTTCIREIFENSWKILKKECTDAKKYDTICNATQRRQTEAMEIAARVGVMVVVGDRKSANTRHLAEICRKVCPRVVQIETAAELSGELFAGCAVAGLTAGASTPAGIIKEVFATMSEEFTNEAVAGSTEPVTEESTIPAAAEAANEEPVHAAETPANETETRAKEEPANEFEEMLNKQSFRTLNTGEKVTGIVRAITSKEVEVDVGAKQTAYIKFSELSDDPNANPEDIVRVGDEIEAYIVRVNDVEGFAELSKRRLDAQKKWEEVEKAVEDKSVHEGVVTEENKGGIVVLVDGIRVFVPASQSGKPRGADLSAMRGQTVRLRITEFNRARRRVVGSIRAVQDEERRAAQDQVWSAIEVGKRYTGVVKSMTSYGVFVDIGGVDGMVHISELSWSRIKDPREVCKVGDTLEVYVISFDPDRRKISLGVKDHNRDPWQDFMNTYSVGDVASVRIVKLMPFGAFAEVVPGVDGLIHISQIADHRVEKPEDELSEGQTVNAKITNIDEERQKISLSIRQAPQQSFEGEAE
ncbi:MAG: bifunctional 4-hydroxy-3-methylbut-2-enyl diphosphate reductase/30S ribosomal protein S1 [Oscillibacter sp.]|nr:bifunctional 4-hydroxy-3-methylbut-2-enyl diphosphate reductase/30S ribosomal protein S1 [Oscillibacter sp.]